MGTFRFIADEPSRTTPKLTDEMREQHRRIPRSKSKNGPPHVVRYEIHVAQARYGRKTYPKDFRKRVPLFWAWVSTVESGWITPVATEIEHRLSEAFKTVSLARNQRLTMSGSHLHPRLYVTADGVLAHEPDPFAYVKALSRATREAELRRTKINVASVGRLLDSGPRL